MLEEVLALLLVEANAKTAKNVVDRWELYWCRWVERLVAHGRMGRPEPRRVQGERAAGCDGF
jgi:hypothetical protein